MHHHLPRRVNLPFFLLLLPLFLIPTYLYVSNLFHTLSLLSRPSNNPLCLPDHLLPNETDTDTDTADLLHPESEPSVIVDFLARLLRFGGGVILWILHAVGTFILGPVCAVLGYLLELILIAFGIVLCVVGNGGAAWGLIGEFIWKPYQQERFQCWEFDGDLIWKRIRVGLRKWFCCCAPSVSGRRKRIEEFWGKSENSENSGVVAELEEGLEEVAGLHPRLTIRDWVALRSLGKFLSVRCRRLFPGDHIMPGCGGGLAVGIVVVFVSLIPGLRFLRLFKPRNECGWFMPLEEMFALILFMWFFYQIGFFAVPMALFVSENKKELSELAAVHLTTSPLLSSVYYRRNLQVEKACSGNPCQLTQRIVQKIMSYLFSPYLEPEGPGSVMEDGFWNQFGDVDPGFAPLNSAYNFLGRLPTQGERNVDDDDPDEAVCRSIVLFHRAVPTARQFEEARLFGHLRLVCRDFYVGLNHMSSRAKFCHLNNLFYVVLRMKSDLRQSDEAYFSDGPSVTWILKRSFWELAVGLFPRGFFFVYRFLQTLLLVALVFLGLTFYLETPVSAIPTCFMFCAWGYAIWIGRRRRWVLETYRWVSEWIHEVLLWYHEEYEMEEYL